MLFMLHPDLERNLAAVCAYYSPNLAAKIRKEVDILI